MVVDSSIYAIEVNEVFYGTLFLAAFVHFVAIKRLCPVSGTRRRSATLDEDGGGDGSGRFTCNAWRIGDNLKPTCATGARDARTRRVADEPAGRNPSE